MKTRDRRDFDLPADLHSEEEKGHFIPRKARSPEEIEARKALRPGALVLFHQAIGTKVMEKTLELIQPDELSEFSRRRIGAAAFNASWYSNARGAHLDEWGNSVMRRRLKLPVHYRKPEQTQVSFDSLVTDARRELQLSSEYADKYATSFNSKNCTILNNKTLYSRAIGRAALIIGSTLEINGILTAYSREEQQEAAMRGAIQIRTDSIQLADSIGSIPTPAQFADFDSHLAVEWRRGGNNAEVEALEQAMTEFRQ